jgi:hypothetical protein
MPYGLVLRTIQRGKPIQHDLHPAQHNDLSGNSLHGQSYISHFAVPFNCLFSEQYSSKYRFFLPAKFEQKNQDRSSPIF